MLKKLEQRHEQEILISTWIFNHNETSQFVNYVVDGTASGLVCASHGQSCKKMIRQNHESVIVCPVVSLAGRISRYFINMFYTLFGYI